jgi:hypothetical protein
VPCRVDLDAPPPQDRRALPHRACATPGNALVSNVWGFPGFVERPGGVTMKRMPRFGITTKRFDHDPVPKSTSLTISRVVTGARDPGADLL